MKRDEKENELSGLEPQSEKKHGAGMTAVLLDEK